METMEKYTTIIYRKEGNKQILEIDNTYTDFEKAKKDLLEKIGKPVEEANELCDLSDSFYIGFPDNVIGKIKKGGLRK
jgi:hypothetical protein